MASTTDRIIALSHQGLSPIAIAAILDLTVAEVKTAQLTLSAPVRTYNTA